MNTVDLTAIKALNLPKVGQLGFVVNDMEKSLSYYSSFYDVDTWYEPIYEQKRYWTDEGEIPLDAPLMMAFTGKMQIELIDASRHSDTIYAKHIQQHGEGLHHLGFYVPSVSQKQDVVKRAGLENILSGEFVTAGGGTAKFAYFDTAAMCGTVLEIIEVRLYGTAVPQTKFFWDLSSITGAVKKVASPST